MRRRTAIVVGLLAVIVALVAAVPFVIDYVERREAKAAVARYAVALDSALTNLRPEDLGTTVLDRESGRVTSYITLLWGRNVYMESELLEMEVLDVRSEDPTVTAVVREKWSYIERDRRSREQIGSEETEEQTLRYTLLPNDGGALAVYLSEILEPDELKAELAK